MKTGLSGCVCDVNEVQTADTQDRLVLHQTQMVSINRAIYLFVCCLFVYKESRNPLCNSHIVFFKKLVKSCLIYSHVNQF